jgi:hypothetical protein
MKTMQRLLREPLLHFLILGSLIFGLYAAVSDPVSAPLNTIVIGPERIDQLSKSYQAVWQRPPSADELRGIIADTVREEVYYREALALGLDTNDAIIRRRLRQKMEFLTDSGAGLLKPVAGELEAHLLANEASFRRSARLAFEQIYLGEQPDPKSTERLLSELQAGSVAESSSQGERSLLPAQLGLSVPEAIDGVFGEDFFQRLAQLPHGRWAGPVASGYGAHLVRISESVASSMPRLEEIHEIVLRDWREAKAQELRELHYARLRERYIVHIRHAETEAPERR